jgi:hypothetical protein
VAWCRTPLAAALAAALLAGCAEEAPAPPAAPAGGWVDPAGEEPVVGSIAVNPADGVPWLSTNTGLFRVIDGAAEPERVTGTLRVPEGTGELSEQLVVHFTGPDELLASGHPAPGQSDLPDVLGLLRSTDAGRTWESVSELGRSDFHILAGTGDRLVGALYGLPQVLVSGDAGKTWETRSAPEPLIDLAVAPDDPERWIATTANGIFRSADEGQTWRAIDPKPNVRLAWPEPRALYRIDPGGPVLVSADGGASWEERGSTGGEPRGLEAASADELYAAQLDGTVSRSSDGGRTWEDLLTP